jgi:hypothetical protein
MLDMLVIDGKYRGIMYNEDGMSTGKYVTDRALWEDMSTAEKIRISSEEIVQRIVGRSSMAGLLADHRCQSKHRWKNRNKVSSGGEAFMIVGSHSKFPKEGGPSDLLVDKKNMQKRRTDLRHQI